MKEKKIKTYKITIKSGNKTKTFENVPEYVTYEKGGIEDKIVFKYMGVIHSYNLKEIEFKAEVTEL